MTTVQKELKKYAEHDLRLARENGSVGIANTRHGKLMEIRYDRTMGRNAYSVLVDWKTRLLFVTKAEALEFVMSAYDVVVEAPNWDREPTLAEDGDAY